MIHDSSLEAGQLVFADNRLDLFAEITIRCVPRSKPEQVLQSREQLRDPEQSANCDVPTLQSLNVVLAAIDGRNQIEVGKCRPDDLLLTDREP